MPCIILWKLSLKHHDLSQKTVSTQLSQRAMLETLAFKLFKVANLRFQLNC